MKKEYEDLMNSIKTSKEQAVMCTLKLLDEKKLEVKDLFFYFLIPIMKELRKENEMGKTGALQNAIIENRLKSAIECTYPYIVKQKAEPLGKKALIVLPKGEEEQVGALIASNMFELAGFETEYVDVGMAQKQIFELVQMKKPHYLVFGLKNYYSAFETKRTIERIRQKYKRMKIVVGGPVFKSREIQSLIEHHYFVKDYSEVFALAMEVKK